MRTLLQIGQLTIFILVEPVRSDTGFRDTVHFFSADLEFNRRAIRADDSGVQRLVAIELGDGNVILELAWHGLEHGVQCA